MSRALDERDLDLLEKMLGASAPTSTASARPPRRWRGGSCATASSPGATSCGLSRRRARAVPAAGLGWRQLAGQCLELDGRAEALSAWERRFLASNSRPPHPADVQAAVGPRPHRAVAGSGGMNPRPEFEELPRSAARSMASRRRREAPAISARLSFLPRPWSGRSAARATRRPSARRAAAQTRQPRSGSAPMNVGGDPVARLRGRDGAARHRPEGAARRRRQAAPLPRRGRPQGRRNGYYMLHLDGRPAGVFGCWKRGIKETWKANGAPLSDFDLAELMRGDRGRAEAARAGGGQAAEGRGRGRGELWRGYGPAPADHPYLVRKRMRPHGARVDGQGRLVLAVADADGKIWSLQTIDADGDKLFMPGGRKKGCMFAVGEPGERIVVAEGFATGASIHEATGLPVAVAFDAGNLEPVAREIRAQAARGADRRRRGRRLRDRRQPRPDRRPQGRRGGGRVRRGSGPPAAGRQEAGLQRPGRGRGRRGRGRDHPRRIPEPEPEPAGTEARTGRSRRTIGRSAWRPRSPS